MKFRYIAITGASVLILASIIMLSDIISDLKSSPQVVFYRNHPDLAYSVFSGCKNHPDPINNCYAAYSAAVSLADSEDCSVAGKATKHRFKQLVEHAKEEVIVEEIDSDCRTDKPRSFLEKWHLKS